MKKEDDYRKFIILTWEIEALYHAIALEFGLTDSAMNILYLISFENGSAMLGDIVKYTGLQKQTINSSMRILEKKGYVRLEKVNGKMKCVHLTDEGSALSGRTVRKLMEWENSTMSFFSEKEVGSFISLLEKYRTEMENCYLRYILEKKNR